MYRSKPSKKSTGLIDRLVDSVRRGLYSKDFGPHYAAYCLLVLFFSTLFWSILGANIQRGNADQLVSPYMFHSVSTFHSSSFPTQHTQLLKWPLFLLAQLFGSTTTALAVFTVLVSMATIGFLTVIIYKIDRRPLIFGTICLALSSVLLLVPAQPYAGALLPVNMAMLTTRNLEYVVYIWALYLLIRSQRFRSRTFIGGSVLLSLLIASDNLFLSLSLGGGLIAGFCYLIFMRRELVKLSSRWIAMSVIGALGGTGLLALINVSKITKIVGSSGAGPYGLVHSFHDLALGTIYGVLNLLTNFGANPAYDQTTFRAIPHALKSRMFGLSGFSFLINGLILLGGLYVIVRLLISKQPLRKSKNKLTADATRLSLLLIFSAVASFGVFVISKHYYPIAIPTFTRGKKFHPSDVALIGMIIAVSVGLGTVGAFRTYRSEQSAMKDINVRNALIAQILTQHPVDVLVGDYWRVIPTRLESGNKLNILPLASCTTPRQLLSSSDWQVNLGKHSFAYLLTLTPSQTDYSACTLNQVVETYGRPNASAVIAGTVSNPEELVLFYDHGAQKSAQKINGKSTLATVLPIPISELPNTFCAVQTDMNIVAHQDDDLLFMNPDLLHDIKAGHCIRTIYITAGDAGVGPFFWLSREKGTEAAYSKMLGTNEVWIHRIVKVSDHQFVTVANVRGNSQISLIFMHFPDGNVNGFGFKGSNYESLTSLESNRISSMKSVDGQSHVSKDDLTNSLTDIMHLYKPHTVRTQSQQHGSKHPDHSDHNAVGKIATQAYTNYNKKFPDVAGSTLKYYTGYPVRDSKENVFGGDLADKESAFLAYSHFDSSVCSSIEDCGPSTTYGAYLRREYQSGY
jgi:LmbE family N-acetylglucosaminyl deacetylase